MLGVQGAGKSPRRQGGRDGVAACRCCGMDVGALYDKLHRRIGAATCARRCARPRRWRRSCCGSTRSRRASRRRRAAAPTAACRQRMFGTLLTWMQERRGPVFLDRHRQRHRGAAAGAAAQGPVRRDLLRRPARTASAREQIFAIHLKKRKRDPAKFDLDALADAPPKASAARRSSRRSSPPCTPPSPQAPPSATNTSSTH